VTSHWECTIVYGKPFLVNSPDMDRQEMASALFQYVSTPKWRRLVTAEDQFYSEAIALVDDALLRLRAVDRMKIPFYQELHPKLLFLIVVGIKLDKYKVEW
jgi:hypothetical protein